VSASQFIAGLIVLTAAAVAAQAQGEDGFVSMFNGKDLSGWEGRPGAWRVEEGAITGESTTEKPCDSTHYLYWTGGEPADFILRFQIKLTGGNSGVQFRSEKRPQYDTFGYQADIDATNQWTGCLFQHRRGAVVKRGSRATISAEGGRDEKAFASMESLAEIVKLDDYNKYEILAKGSKVTLRINDRLMCEVDDRDATHACRKGIIALQMHKGPPMKVQFKNLRIKVLDGQE
jgi:hypothetical protein